MNERIKELAEQAGLISTWEGWVSTQKQHAEGVCDEYLERFADLIRHDETKACAKHYLSIMRDAVEQAVLKEREACAKVCDEASLYFEYDRASPEYSADYCAKAIRARRT